MVRRFIGRTKELSWLRQLKKRDASSMVVIKGRRRIGKSRLIAEFAKHNLFYTFSGIPITDSTTAQSERDVFTQQLSTQLNLPHVRFDDWVDIFQMLAREVENQETIILLDEISWMGSKDPDFLGKLKNIWDLQLKKNPRLMLILCGSVSSWIEKNIMRSTGFLGRPTLYMTLDELPLIDCNQFWPTTLEISNYEKLKILSVTGGVPRYLELIEPQLSAEQNIKALCFSKYGILVDEFERIFSDIFMQKSATYKKVVAHLANGMASQSDLRTALNYHRSGDISEYLNDLVLAGFVARDFTWHVTTGKASRLSHYRLKDNYVRFYLKYILPNKVMIEKDALAQKALPTLSSWYTMMGLQFENLVINNRQAVLKAIGINEDEVIFDNPFFQRKTTRQLGCQIDYLIQTRFDSLYLCEIKFSRHPIKTDVIEQMQEKLKRLNKPKYLSCRCVLIHVNGVTEELIESQYFYKIIDFGELLFQYQQV